MIHIQSATAEIRRGKEEGRKRETTAARIYWLLWPPYGIGQAIACPILYGGHCAMEHPLNSA